jgi:hypothetical protein
LEPMFLEIVQIQWLDKRNVILEVSNRGFIHVRRGNAFPIEIFSSKITFSRLIAN